MFLGIITWVSPYRRRQVAGSFVRVWYLKYRTLLLSHNFEKSQYSGRQYELEHCAIKAMRAILMGFMRQAERLEKFKNSPSPEYALKICFNFVTGGLDYNDKENNSYNDMQQLQLDVVATYLIFLCEMIDSGIRLELYSLGFLSQ